jgi:DNA-binding response OmpR family regulator
MILREIGLKDIFSVESVLAARELAQGISFDFVFLCWQPGAHDMESLLEDIRCRNPIGSGPTRILIVSDEGRAEHVMRMLGHGVDAYIVRPFSRAVILKHMTRLASEHADPKVHYL